MAEVRGSEERPSRFGPWRRELSSFAELFALAGVAIAQPTFSVVGNNAAELIANGRSRTQILLMVLLVLVIPATLAWLAEVFVGLAAPSFRRVAHTTIAGAFVAVLAVEVLKHSTSLSTAAVVIAGVGCGVAGAVLLMRLEVVGRFLRYLAVAPVAFAALFVFSSPATSVFFPRETASAGATVGKPSRVVMVVLDELPLGSLLDTSGSIDPALFPNFAQLARQSNWYRNSTTVSPETQTAVPAILSGRLPPSEDTLPSASEYPQNLFTLLGGRYTMNVHENRTALCPASTCSGPTNRNQDHPGLRGLLVDTAKLWRDFASPDRESSTDANKAFDLTGTDRGQLTTPAFIRSLAPSSQPRLDYLHVLLPHQGWHFLGSGQDNLATFETGQVLDDGGRAVWPDQGSALVGRQRHRAQLQYTDQLIGQIVRKLQRIGAYDDSLIVVTADHGIAFTGSEPVRGVSSTNYPQVLWTPLLVKLPGQTAGTVSDQPVRSIDILPTIADVLDVEMPSKVDGRSMLRQPREEGPVPILEWEQNTIDRPTGTVYSDLDGGAGFAAVLASARAEPTGDPTLRVYRTGPYGRLVGVRTASLAPGAPAGLSASIVDAPKFDAVDPAAHYVPWTWVKGSLSGVRAGQTIAVSVNGTIAGLGEASKGSADDETFWILLAPQFFTAGQNEIALARVDGTPGEPRLTPIPAQP